MTVVIIIEKENIKENSINDINDLYKKCKFKKADGFNEIKQWNFNTKIIKLFGKITGKNIQKNLYDFPDLNTSIYGSCALVCYENNEIVDINISSWNEFKNNKDLKQENNVEYNNTEKFNEINIDNKLCKEEIDSDDEKEKEDEKEKDDDLNDYDELEENELSGEEDCDFKENSDIEYDDEKEIDNNEEEKYFSGSELTEDLYIYSSDED